MFFGFFLVFMNILYTKPPSWKRWLSVDFKLRLLKVFWLHMLEWLFGNVKKKNRAVDVVFLGFCVVVKFAILYVCVSVFLCKKNKNVTRLIEDCLFVCQWEDLKDFSLESKKWFKRDSSHISQTHIFVSLNLYCCLSI